MNEKFVQSCAPAGYSRLRPDVAAAAVQSADADTATARDLTVLEVLADRVGDVAQMVEALNWRLSRIGDRLHGPVPEKNGEAVTKCLPSGTIEAAHESISLLKEMVATSLVLLNRIEHV